MKLEFMNPLPILIIDDEVTLRSLLSQILRLEGFTVLEADTASEGERILTQERICVVVTDVKLPDANGVGLVSKLKDAYPDIEIIVITAFGTIHDGVEAMRNGAFDYITKGDEDDRIVLTIEKAVEKADLRRQLRELQQRIESKLEFSKLIGKSEPFSRAIELAKRVAQTDTTVLLLGETGTGKELFAEAIHHASKRRDRSFVAINCSAIPRDLQESELFGHRKGTFTGAANDKVGLFEEAHRGTIFLDEIGDMTLETQTKLLRAIETKTITRLGETKPRQVDIRIIAATNANLQTAIEEKHFREDLYYRLNGFTIYLPSLRERPDDIELLATHFLSVLSLQLNKPMLRMSSQFVARLKSHRWPGNIRELKNVIERGIILASSNILTDDLLPAEIANSNSTAVNTENRIGITLEALERKYITEVLAKFGDNKTQVAKILGISSATLYRKIKEFGI